jgi:protein TonB
MPSRPIRPRSRPWWGAVLCSLLAHGLFLLLYSGQRGAPGTGPAPASENRIEVSLVSPRPKAATTPPAEARSDKPAPAEPRPVPKPQPTREKAAVRPRPPLTKPKPAATPPLQEFRDEFAGLSHSFSEQDATAAPARSSSGASGLGLLPGSILNINPRIKYPRHAVQRGVEGTVVVLIHIDTDGSCYKVDVLQSSGYEELDNEVIGAVQHWRFKPPVQGGMAVRGTYKHTVIFGVDRVYTDDFERHWREARIMPAQ